MTTTLDPWDRAAIARSMAATCYLRRSPWPDGGRSGHREWLHFTVHAADLVALINLSIVDDLRPAAEPHRERARALVLARDARGWHGGIAETADVELRGGQLVACMGGLAVAADGAVVAMRGALAGHAIELDLVFEARSFPSMASSISIGPGAPIQWVVVPHLAVRGEISVAGRTYPLDGAVGYHDHNWGFFSQRDLAWQWGHSGGRGPHHVVLARLLDGARNTTYLQSLLVWSGARQARVFRGAELEVELEGFLRPERPFTVPRAAALLVDGCTTDVPRRLLVRAAADGDALEGVFEADSVARIVVPHDDASDTTAIHEVTGSLCVRGTLHGRAFDLAAPAMFELLRSVP